MIRASSIPLFAIWAFMLFKLNKGGESDGGKYVYLCKCAGNCLNVRAKQTNEEASKWMNERKVNARIRCKIKFIKLPPQIHFLMWIVDNLRSIWPYFHSQVQDEWLLHAYCNTLYYHWALSSATQSQLTIYQVPIILIASIKLQLIQCKSNLDSQKHIEVFIPSDKKNKVIRMFMQFHRNELDETLRK